MATPYSGWASCAVFSSMRLHCCHTCGQINTHTAGTVPAAVPGRRSSLEGPRARGAPCGTCAQRSLPRTWMCQVAARCPLPPSSLITLCMSLRQSLFRLAQVSSFLGRKQRTSSTSVKTPSAAIQSSPVPAGWISGQGQVHLSTPHLKDHVYRSSRFATPASVCRCSRLCNCALAAGFPAAGRPCSAGRCCRRVAGCSRVCTPECWEAGGE